MCGRLGFVSFCCGRIDNNTVVSACPQEIDLAATKCQLENSNWRELFLEFYRAICLQQTDRGWGYLDVSCNRKS